MYYKLWFFCYTVMVMALVPAQTQQQDTIALTEEIDDAYRIRKSDSVASRQRLQNALETSKALQFEAGIFSASSKLCVFYFYKREYDTAIDCYTEQLQYAQETNYTKGFGISYFNIGTMYQFKSEYEKALEYYMKGLRYLDEEDESHLLVLLKVYQNIGYVNSRFKKYEAAESGYIKAIAIAEKIKDNQGMLGNSINLSLTYCKTNQLDKANLQYHYTEELLKKVKDSSLIEKYTAYVKAGYANVFFEKGQYDKALTAAMNAYAMTKGKNTRVELNTLMTLAEIYKKTEQSILAEKYYHDAITLSTIIKQKTERLDAFLALYQLYESQGKSDLALKYYKDYVALNDDILSDENEKQLDRIALQYEAEKKNKKVIQEKLELEQDINQISKYAMAGVVVFGFVFVFLTYRLFKANKDKKVINLNLEHKNQQLQKSIQQKEDLESKIENIQNKMHKHLDDNFGNRLSGIKSSYEILKEIEKDNPQESSAYLKFSNHIEEGLAHLSSDLKDLVWSNQTENAMWSKLVERITIVCQHFEKLYNIKIDANTDIAQDFKLLRYFNRHLLILVKEVINHAFKVGNATTIDITISSDANGDVSIRCIDDGKKLLKDAIKSQSFFDEIEDMAKVLGCQLTICTKDHSKNSITLEGNLKSA